MLRNGRECPLELQGAVEASTLPFGQRAMRANRARGARPGARARPGNRASADSKARCGSSPAQMRRCRRWQRSRRRRPGTRPGRTVPSGGSRHRPDASDRRKPHARSRTEPAGRAGIVVAPMTRQRRHRGCPRAIRQRCGSARPGSRARNALRWPGRVASAISTQGSSTTDAESAPRRGSATEPRTPELGCDPVWPATTAAPELTHMSSGSS